MTLVLAIENPDGSVLMVADSYIGDADTQGTMRASKILQGYGDYGSPSRVTYLVGYAGSLRAMNVISSWLAADRRPLTKSSSFTLAIGGQERWVVDTFVPGLIAELGAVGALGKAEDETPVASVELLVAVAGQVFEMDAYFGVHRTARPFHAVGNSGGICAAIGSLHTSRQRKNPLSRATVAMAIAADIASKEIRLPWTHQVLF